MSDNRATNKTKIPPWPFCTWRQPATKVPTSPWLGPATNYGQADKEVRSFDLGKDWKLKLYRNRLELTWKPDYDPDEDHSTGFSVDENNNPIILNTREGLSTIPPAAKFLRDIDGWKVPVMFARKYSIIWFPSNPPSWRGRSVDYNSDYYVDENGKQTSQYIGTWIAHKWWGLSRSGYDHNQCHINFGRWLRISWNEHHNYMHWFGTQDQEELYWDAVAAYRKRRPIRSWIRRRYYRALLWFFR